MRRPAFTTVLALALACAGLRTTARAEEAPQKPEDARKAAQEKAAQEKDRQRKARILQQLAQQRIVIQQNVRGRVRILPNGRVVEGQPEPGLSGHKLYVENRSVTNALDRAKSQLEGLDDVEDAEARLARTQRAIDALQKVLELDEDFAYSPNPDDRTHFRSVKSEAEGLIAELPPEGRELYEQDYGPIARRALDRALAASDVAALESVVRKFFHTRAGYEAAYRLGTLQLDRGESLAAALVFQRLKQFPAAERWEPMLSLRTAVAWGRAGLPEQSERTLVEFKRKLGDDSIVLGGETIDLFGNESEAVAWLVDVLGREPRFANLGEERWTVFRGNPSRTGTARPASPVWRVKWRHPTIERPEATDEVARRLVGVVEELRNLEASHRRRNLLVTPSMHPLVVGNAVVFRTFDNVRAVDLSSGEVVWEAASHDKMFEQFWESDDAARRANGRNVRVVRNGVPVASPLQRFLGERAWKDLTVGTLSSDGRFVYAIEGIDFPGGMARFDPNVRGGGGESAGSGHNKLMAIDAATGKLAWEIGGPPGAEGVELAGSFFLGPPLPFGDRLYCLLERAGELRLAVLRVEPTRTADGRAAHEPVVEWTQSLLLPEFGVEQSPVRRLAGLSPSYADGVLVCPTAAGAVVAVDLSRRQLMWGHRYETVTSSAAGDAVVGRVRTASVPRNDDEERWLDSTPTIADGYAVLTPRDSHELHCVNLVTGERAWPPKPRGDGLYVAGVVDGAVVIVGRTGIRAWKLSDGTPAWNDPVPIAMPAGRGVRAGNLYHLPLQTGGVATIDLAAGRLLGVSPSTTGRVPGNLVAAGGGLVSLSPDSLVALESLEAIEARIRQSLEKNARDAEALLLRGELRLHRGEEQAALADLEQAMENGAGERAETLLLTTLLEGLRLDFESYRERAERAVAATDDPKLEREYRRLHARGLERTGQRLEAFGEYVKLAGITGDSNVAARTDDVHTNRWIRPRLESLFADATDAERADMTADLERELAAAEEAGDVDRLRQLATAFGRLPIADRAGLALAERLTDSEQALERELALAELRSADTVATRARATALLARTALETDRPRDAEPFLSELEDRYADVRALDEATGGELVERWREEYDLASKLNSDAWPSKKTMVVDAKPHRTNVAQSYRVEVRGPAGPYFGGWTFFLDNQRRELVAVDRDGRQRWTVRVHQGNQTVSNPFGNFLRIRGHAIVGCFGTDAVVIDTLHASGKPTVLWRRDLNESADSTANIRQVAGPGGLQMVVVDRFGRPLGTVGAVTHDAVVYQVGTTLHAADLLTGEEFWQRPNVPRASDVFADDQHVFVVEDGAASAMLLRGDDGHLLGTRVIPKNDERLFAEGRTTLVWSRAGEKAKLSLFDVLEQRVLWSRTFDGRSKPTLVEDEDVAVFEPDGRFHVIRIADGQTLVDQPVAAAPAVSTVTVLRTAESYLLLPYDPTRNRKAGLRAAGIGYNNPMVSGEVAAFDRETGELRWTTVVENQALPLEQAPDVPALLFTSRTFQIVRQPGRVVNSNRYTVLLLDKRTGNIVLEESDNRPAFPFLTNVEPDEDRIEYVFAQQRVELTFEDAEPEPERPKAEPENDDEPKPEADDGNGERDGAAGPIPPDPGDD